MTLGILLIIGIDVLALILHDRHVVLIGAGIAAALVLLNIRRALGRGNERDADADVDDLKDSLQRWLSTTETTIRWADSTRTDWDRHLRPMLARRFELATGQRLTKNPAAFYATGRMLFGAELWEWVNPNNVTRTGDRQPGPGRGALEEILQRLEQV
jgi:hypothetical protein